MDKRTIPIVNVEYKIICHKEWIDIDNTKDIYRSASLWLTNPTGYILIAQRSYNKRNNPGKWGPAAEGTVEEGETYESNIYKEAEEELGLHGIVFSMGPKILRGQPHPQWNQLFTGVCDWPVEKFVIQREEVAQIVWISQVQLRTELAETPEKYLSVMAHLAELFLLK